MCVEECPPCRERRGANNIDSKYIYIYQMPLLGFWWNAPNTVHGNTQLICGFVFRVQSDLLEAHFGQSLSFWAVS
jgi:hypothetical protein